MARFFFPIMILEAYCLYHAYQNRVHFIWFYLIVLAPFLGSLVYIYKFIYSSEKISSLTEEVKEVIDSSYTEKKLVHNLNHSDTVQNKMKLAEEYFNKGDFLLSISLYESCLNSISNDPDIFKKLVLLHYYNKEYSKAIEYGKRIGEDPFFKNDEERIALAWSYYEIDDIDSAEETFRDMNRVFSNYIHRLEYVKFLKLIDREVDAKRLLEVMTSEFERMDRTSRKQKRHIYNMIVYANKAYIYQPK